MNYKDTIFLPKTDFPMKAGLPQREPDMLARWEGMNIYGLQRAAAKGREKFILHDGPPYANGHLHIGHALNKILKDVISRSQQMMGKDSNYVPGWDCHGLPIEWKIEEKYLAAGKNKDEVDLVAFRKECRDFAAGWIDIQREEFKRMGVVGDWDNPYTTMNYHAEARIAGELGKFLLDGSLYRGARPIMWSVVEKTALAEAEVEYHDHNSNTVYVRFPVAEASTPELEGASVVIWTTTPWTLPGNRAVAYGADIDYVVLRPTFVTKDDEKMDPQMTNIVIAKELVDEVCEAAGIAEHEIIAELKGSDLDGTILSHPLKAGGYDFDVPMLEGDFVEVDTGTGFVHIAPGHGADDWELSIANNIPVPDTVGPDGAYFDHVPLFAGLKVLGSSQDGKKYYFPANKVVMAEMKKAGGLLASGKLTHSYPHSWRSKAPLIFRNTPQWFISMEKTGLRDKALKAIEETTFVPKKGKNRLRGMIETRPDWCVSRQRAWGVPITVFVNKKTGQPLRDEAVMARIVDIFESEGADAWFASDPARFLGDDYAVDEYEQVTDILDVWFDSGCTHTFVLEDREDLSWPASLYLEGSDQHRGWFHSSLLESCGTRGRAPYDAILTHGFILDEKAEKMSKSQGNALSPDDVYQQYGADILRLWVVGTDYTEDPVFGPETLKQMADIYRRLRNTLRYLLGNLNGFEERERLDVAEMPELDRWVLHRLWELDSDLHKACDSFQFHSLFAKLHTFCAVDLSAFYFDIRKDALYCDGSDTLTRRATRTVLDHLFNTLTAWFAPFIVFTTEEAWLARNPGETESVHLRTFPDVPEGWRDDELAAKWARVRDLRRVVTGALEVERAEKRIGSSLQAAPQVFAEKAYVDAMTGVDLAEIAISSVATLAEGDGPTDAFRLSDVPGIAVVSALAEGEKCERCWKITNDVGSHDAHPTLCGRCATAVPA